ncbi:3D domain-containing protein [Patescibacteria group bacterium]|nr:3D domain-containing protein [Patescibacteria group bacterium]
MSKNLKHLNFEDKNILIIVLIGIGFFIGGGSIFEARTQKIDANLSDSFIEEVLEDELAIIQENSLLPISDHLGPEPKVARKIKVIVTAYSSSARETDNNPYLTAAGTWVKEGIVANNLLSFGTKVRIPEIYGEKIFVVEDRMHWKKGNFHIDIWFPSYWEALNFGAKRTYIEILEG